MLLSQPHKSSNFIDSISRHSAGMRHHNFFLCFLYLLPSTHDLRRFRDDDDHQIPKEPKSNGKIIRRCISKYFHFRFQHARTHECERLSKIICSGIYFKRILIFKHICQNDRTEIKIWHLNSDLVGVSCHDWPKTDNFTSSTDVVAKSSYR